jgi:prepilin-type N-terminal cleavage/methylation domain-containing protein
MHPTPARAGMTLLELLVVMMIIATLASLIISAVFTMRESQMKSFTETLVNKLASATVQQWNAAVDQIREEPVPNWALTMANGDPRIAKVIYLKARLKQEFPVSFYQAMYPNANFGPQTGAPVGYMTSGGAADLPPKPTYQKALLPLIGTAQIPPTAAGGVPPPLDFESSALLYLALIQGRRGQTGFNPDENIEATAIQTRTVNGVTFKIFVDSWGNPIRFWACPYGNLELNSPPYLQNVSAQGVATVQNQQSPDPQDPDQALAGFKSAAFAKMVHLLPAGTPGDPLHMLIPVVGSIGRDGVLGVDPFDMTPDGTTGGNDNIYNYRLRRSGQRGD